MIELEKTYLAKYLPQDLLSGKSKETLDIYFPADRSHTVLRLRKQGEVMELTKKTIISGTDSSKMREETIVLDDEEYAALAQLPGKRLHKIRYYYAHEGLTAEFDVFQDKLAGLVLVDVEFTSENEQSSFVMPDFCLAEVTQEAFLAGGMLCGKSYADIEKELSRYNYQPPTV